MRAAAVAVAATPAVMTLTRESPPAILAVVLAFLLAAVFAGGAGERFVGRLRATAASGPILVLGVALLWLVASIAWTPVPGRGATHALHMVGGAVAVTVLFAAARESAGHGRTAPGRPVPFGMLLAGGIAVASVLVLVGVGPRGAIDGVSGLAAEGYRLNRAAVAIALLLPLALTLLWRGGRKPLAAALLPLAGAAILVSLSSSAKLALLIAALATPLALARPLAAHRAFAVAAIGAVLVAPFVGPYVNDLLPRRIHEIGGYGSMTLRAEIWREYSLLLWERPWFGFGVEAGYAVAGTPVAASLGEWNRSLLNWGHPHNAALQIWFELGAVGAALAAILLGLLFRALERLPPSILPAASVTALAACAVAFVSHGAWQAWWYCLLGLIAVAFVFGHREDPAAADRAPSGRGLRATPG
ncbi:MAG TPA: O-antigen ligase family protein [Beijerinckiaceae bacterium]|nr:O-antigen ligase family protein [Beijerinckiaceae bacterium]